MRRDDPESTKLKGPLPTGGSPESPLDRIDGLYPYLRTFYQRASQAPGIRGRVFIVGGTEHEALACLALGADEAVVANPWFAEPWYEKRLLGFSNPNVHLHGTFAEDVEIEPGSVDMVLSACVIEHIHHSRNLNRLSPSQIEEMALVSTLHCLSFKRIYDRAPGEEVAQALSGSFTFADLSTWAVELLLEKRAGKSEKNTPAAGASG